MFLSYFIVEVSTITTNIMEISKSKCVSICKSDHDTVNTIHYNIRKSNNVQASSFSSCGESCCSKVLQILSTSECGTTCNIDHLMRVSSNCMKVLPRSLQSISFIGFEIKPLF